MSKTSMETANILMNASSLLPDVSHEREATIHGAIETVGMESIEMPIRWKNGEGPEFFLPARIDATVNLKEHSAKGIHMSRLYLSLSKWTAKSALTLASLKKILIEFVEDQNGLSDSASIRIRFDLPIQRKALVSDKLGWRQYPIELGAYLQKGDFGFYIGGEVLYSSTCPCSAALARQAMREKFEADFSTLDSVSVDAVADWLTQESSVVATPHAQRSSAYYKVQFVSPQFAPTPLQLIDLIEDALGTAVQSAVKRQDEQEFARLNGSNLMFCEDAARKVRQVLDTNSRVSAYHVKFVHRESLHPHDAVAEISKGRIIL
ncbi:MAG: GTP cyclohydrolase I FolE2 [Bdellovibrionales bacterium]|nr:GTP cyclohydrolase I FolE2 [Bdellovibrionales bacterium]